MHISVAIYNHFSVCCGNVIFGHRPNAVLLRRNLKGHLHVVRIAAVIQNIFSIGFNHHNLNAASRSIYALNNEKRAQLFERSADARLGSLTVLNTCNRTELYGYGAANDAKELLLDVLGGEADEQEMFSKSGREAIHHIFKVASGLDSQIVGDLEILGQFKQAFREAKGQQRLNNVSERLADSCMRAAKEIKNQTKLSAGTISHAYAAVRLIRDEFEGRPCRVVVVGAGKFGARVAKNLHDYFPEADLLVCNRTARKAMEIAALNGGQAVPFDGLEALLPHVDVVISSVHDTGGFVINAANAGQTAHNRMFIDLSVPLSIDPVLGSQTGIRLVSLDDVGKVITGTLEARKEDIPRAQQIIDKHIDEFCAWTDIFGKSTSIMEWKGKMEQLAGTCPYLKQLGEPHKQRLITRSIATFATFLRSESDLPQASDEIIARFVNQCEQAVACQKNGFELHPETVCCSCLTR